MKYSIDFVISLCVFLDLNGDGTHFGYEELSELWIDGTINVPAVMCATKALH